jgi:uncharacterized protein with PIN domain
VKPRPAEAHLFVESSALVAWILWEARGREVATCLRAAKVAWISALAVPESCRALLRAASAGRVDDAYVRRARRRLAALSAGCRVIPVDEDILERVGQAFPIEPIRTLDAVHLASLERAQSVSTHLALLSLDDRVRANATNMRIRVLP